jgi:hypothetical protein
MQITLYKAAETVRHLLEQIDPETGELPEGFEQSRAIVATKAQAVAAFILSNEAEADMVETHAKELLNRVKTARKRSDWLKQYLHSHMSACGITEIKSEDGTFKASLSIGRDESVEIFDSSMLPNDYWTDPKPPEPSPDKTLIKKAIKDGFDVPGARLIKKDRLTIK